MSSKRRSYETGHKPQIPGRHRRHRGMRPRDLLGGQRAGAHQSQIVMLRVIETGDRNQQWLGVADIMKAEAHEAANAALDKFAARANEHRAASRRNG